MNKSYNLYVQLNSRNIVNEEKLSLVKFMVFVIWILSIDQFPKTL